MSVVRVAELPADAGDEVGGEDDLKRVVPGFERRVQRVADARRDDRARERVVQRLRPPVLEEVGGVDGDDRGEGQRDGVPRDPRALESAARREDEERDEHDREHRRERDHRELRHRRQPQRQPRVGGAARVRAQPPDA